jgi:hypothetical protein
LLFEVGDELLAAAQWRGLEGFAVRGEDGQLLEQIQAEEILDQLPRVGDFKE